MGSQSGSRPLSLLHPFRLLISTGLAMGKVGAERACQVAAAFSLSSFRSVDSSGCRYRRPWAYAWSLGLYRRQAAPRWAAHRECHASLLFFVSL